MLPMTFDINDGYVQFVNLALVRSGSGNRIGGRLDLNINQGEIFVAGLFDWMGTTWADRVNTVTLGDLTQSLDDYLYGVDEFVLGAAGGMIDTRNLNVTITQPLTNENGVAGSSALVKRGYSNSQCRRAGSGLYAGSWSGEW
jgi:hypothetical protein